MMETRLVACVLSMVLNFQTAGVITAISCSFLFNWHSQRH